MIRAFALIACLIPATVFAQSNPEPSRRHGSRTSHDARATHDVAGATYAARANDAGPATGGRGRDAARRRRVRRDLGDRRNPRGRSQDRLVQGQYRRTSATSYRHEQCDARRECEERTDRRRHALRRHWRRSGSRLHPRMTTAHAATMNGVDGWKFEAAEIEGGASLTVHPPAKDVDKLRGLGFLGVLTLGMHHQEHHLMIARGENPHG